MLKLIKPGTALLLVLISCSGFAASADPHSSIEAQIDGKKVSLPLLKSEILAKVKGDLVTVSVKQTFSNPHDKPLHATYLFPLNHDAAVQQMLMSVGDERVEAKIQRIAEAQATFAQAKQQGHTAALLTEHRPNMFTQDIANLMPNQPVQVTLTYSQTLPKLDGQYELVLPLVVGPRYQPAGSAIPPTPVVDVNSKSSFGSWQVEKLPSYPEVAGLNSPEIIDKERVALRVELDAGLPIAELSSKTHVISTEQLSAGQRVIQLDAGKTIDNKDFVLRYRLSGTSTQAGLLAHQDARGGFFSVQIEPPALPASKDIAAREMVFVLDTSGSMAGEPIAASKQFMQHALHNLHANDYFRIIHFSNNADEFSAEPVAATSENIRQGLNYVNGLVADGGTEIPSAIEQAFAKPAPTDALRIVVFLTDGYIGNEAQVLAQIAEKIGSARIYALGVGSSVNRFLLEEMANRGRGFARFIDPTEKADDVAIQLAGKLESPVLTDIAIDWGDLQVSDILPSKIPDLFAGSALRIYGKYQQSGQHIITINGLVNGRKARLPITVNLPVAAGNPDDPIPVIWARSQIAEAMRQISTPMSLRTEHTTDNDLKNKITDLGLNFSLSTQWTAFVAVSQKVLNAHPEQTEHSNIPLPVVAGTTAKAYGENPQQSAAAQPMMVAQNFSGAAAPEPSTIASMLVLAGIGIWTCHRRKKIEGNHVGF